MNIAELLHDACATSPGQVQIPPGWGQGRATFGGLLAACLFEKLLPHVTGERPVRSLMLSFVAPVAPGAMDVRVQVLREGKAATQLQATGYQDDQACVVLLASFGGARESVVALAGEPAPAIADPDSATRFPFIAGLTPDFTQHFDYRYAVGKMPFMGGEEPRLGGWIRLREPARRAVQMAELLCLLDAWPPAVFCLLKQPAAGSSLTWSIGCMEIPTDCTAGDWWQYQAEIRHSAAGYSHVDATLWDRLGHPVLLSRQTVSVFA